MSARMWGGGRLSQNADTAEGVGVSDKKLTLEGWESQGLEQKSKQIDTNNHQTNKILPES